MGHWQFLIQKQGDRFWHSLEAPNMELIEGRYRVVARSDRKSTDVEVRIIYTSTTETPQKRRMQKRSRRTNAEGLMAVLPFTHLKPGIWELRCSGDIMSDFLGESWQYSIQLQVLPGESPRQLVSEPTNTIEPPSHEEETQTTPISDALVIIEQPINPVWLQGQTAEQILQNLLEVALPPSEPLLEDEAGVKEFPVTDPEPILLLTLEQEIYTVRWGKTLTVKGLVELKDRTNLDQIFAQELLLELRSPQRSEVLSQVRQPLAEKSLPFTIQSSVEIPAGCESKLILADISVYGTCTSSGETTLLATQSFTITADLAEILAVTATVKPRETEIQDNISALTTSKATAEQLATPVSLDLELFNLVKSKKITKALLLQPSPKKSLPPLLHPRSLPKPEASHSPQLPRFDHGHTQIGMRDQRKQKTTFPYLRRLDVLPKSQEQVTSTPPVQQADQLSSIEILDEALLPDQPLPGPQETSSPLEDPLASEIVLSNLDLVVTGNPCISPLIQKWMQKHGYVLPAPINLQNHDSEAYILADPQLISQEIDSETPTIIQEEPTHLSSPIPPLPQSAEGARSRARLAKEIVVDDIDEPVEAITEEQQAEPLPLLTPPTTEEVLQPLSIPQLYMQAGELISGKTVTLRIQLADQRPQIAVKLWVEDCHTRALIDGPRLLTNLLPNSSGCLETMTLIRVPFGCLEIRLEAIAFDMVTQQESHKVTIQKTVVPPDLPNWQPDEVLGL